MSWFRKSKDIITVEFIESGTNDPFAVSEVPVEQLPDTFELETNLEIGGQQWIVAQAFPNKKEDFIKTGKLQVFLNKIQTVDSKEILFSLPTINDSIFETEITAGENLFSIHEDDWRQMEFISKEFDSEINQEAKEIIEIYENYKVGIGFDNVHIRQLIEQPLQNKNISLDSFTQDFGVINKFDGFGMGNNKAKNSFAFQVTEETFLYGQTNNAGEIIYLCIKSDENLQQTVEKIIENYDVVFVDWCKAEIIGK